MAEPSRSACAATIAQEDSVAFGLSNALRLVFDTAALRPKSEWLKVASHRSPFVIRHS
jgi:hypothetical protein